MRAHIITLFAVLTTSAIAHSQPQAALCKDLAKPLVDAATGVRSMAEATKAVDLSKAISQFAGEERKALEALDRRNAEARKVLSAYADELEDAAYLMQKCAR